MFPRTPAYLLLSFAIAQAACVPASKPTEPPNDHGASLPRAVASVETAPTSAPQIPTSETAASVPIPAPEEAVPRRAGPCPPPSQAAKNVLANAWKLAQTTDAVEPHHAIAEALRMRVDELFQSGCQPSLSDDQLKAELVRLAPDAAEPPDLFAHRVNPSMVMVGHNSTRGSGVTLLAWARGKVRTRIDVTNEGQAMEEQMELLDAAALQPPGAPEPLLAVASTHVWHTSCWRALRFRVLAAGAAPSAPSVLVDHKVQGRWCEDVRIEARGAELRFHYDGWGRLLAREGPRPYTLAYRYESGAWERRFGFVSDLHLLVEDWLTDPWELAQQATAETARDRLRPTQDALAGRAAAAKKNGDAPSFTSELFPAGSPTKRRVVVYCALSSSAKACPDWPKPVDFALEQSAGTWQVVDAQQRP